MENYSIYSIRVNCKQHLHELEERLLPHGFPGSQDQDLD